MHAKTGTQTHATAGDSHRDDGTRDSCPPWHADPHAVAEAVRQACMRTADAAYRDAAVSGLCSEGAIEVAMSAVAALDVDAIVTRIRHDAPTAGHAAGPRAHE